MSDDAPKRPGEDHDDAWVGLVRALVHDLRTPIATAAGYVELAQLDASELPEGIVESLDLAAAALQEVSALVTLVGDIARLESGRRPLALAPAEPGRLIERALTRRTRRERERIEIAPVETDAGAPVRCDGELVARAVDALIHFAFARSPHNAGVTVLAGRRDNRFRFTVRDRGTPIAADRLGQLYVHRRRRGESSSAAKLALVYSRLVAEAHGGEAGASAPVGGGMEFWLELDDARESSAGA